MSDEQIKEMVFEIALDSAKKGPGWAQEGIVLRAVRERMPAAKDKREGLPLQQLILNAWHDLFVEKKLAWGYDLDNPSAPFFHVR
jgi:hypothetical protein